ncbi:hypothetical protein ACQJBY_051980 [Aegilops geniculata]
MSSPIPPLPANSTTAASAPGVTASLSAGATASLSEPPLTAPGTTPGQGQPPAPVQHSPPPSPPPQPQQFTPEAMAGVLHDLVAAVQGIRLYLAGPYGPPPPLHPAMAAGPQALPWYSVPGAITGGYPTHPAPAAATPPWPQWPPQIAPASAPLAATTGPQWPTWTAPAAPSSAAPYLPAASEQVPPPAPPSPNLGRSSPSGLPIQEVRFPPPPTPQATVQQHHQAPPPSTAPPPASRATGRPLHQVQFPPSPSPIPTWATGSSPGPVYSTAPEHPTPSLRFDHPSSSANYAPEIPEPAYALPATAAAPGHGGPTPPRFAKLDFATYEGTEDPLNWLNQCEQFFRGQRTLASDRTWLASYHLRGAAQTWYHALEQDEGGMPPWERFRELCLLRFGPPIRGSRLAALGRLPFTSTVQDYADRFQALACHAPGVSATQRAELFVGGLPDHIRVDVELRDPPDLQTAMYYARAFERRAVAIQQESPSRAVGSLLSPDPAQGRTAQASAAPPAATAARPFHRLTSTEILERHRQRLCFNCDEPYKPGHAYPRLFYLEVADYIPEDAIAADLAVPDVEKMFDAG